MTRPLPLLLACGALVLAGCDEALEFREVGEPLRAFDPLALEEPPHLARDTPPLRFAVPLYFDRSRQEAMVARLTEALGNRIGTAVQGQVVEGYEETLQTLRRGEADVAQLSPWACATAGDDVDIFAAAAAEGSSTYQSYLLVRRESPWTGPGQLKGARFAVSSRRSASAWLYPRALLAAQGVDLERDLVLVDVASHDAALDALLAGDVDVAAPSSDTVVARGALRPLGPVRILAQAARIPFDCVAVRKGALRPEVLARVRYAFWSLSALTPVGRRALEGYMTFDGFFPADQRHYAGLAEAIRRP